MSQYALLALGLWLLTVITAVALTRNARKADAIVTGREVPALGRWLRRVFAADPAGARHAAAVAAHARWLGSVAGLSRVEHGHVYVAALLHGVESLDTRVDELAWEQEDAEVRVLEASFAARGAHMLRDVNGLEPAARIAASCRERYDGTGYPRGLAGDAIPLGARIIAVAEAYVGLLHAPDDPLSPTAAIERLADGKGHALDPTLVAAFAGHVSKAMIDVSWSAQDTAWIMSPRTGPPQR